MIAERRTGAPLSNFPAGLVTPAHHMLTKSELICVFMGVTKILFGVLKKGIRKHDRQSGLPE